MFLPESATTCGTLINPVAAPPMRIRHASLAIDRLRWGATDCELFLSADNTCDSFRPPVDVPENQIAEFMKQPGQFKYQRVPMAVNTLRWIQISTFRLRSAEELSL